MKHHSRLIMIGPDPDGLGGISNTVKLWKECGVLSDHNILYIPSVKGTKNSLVKKITYLIKGLFNFSIEAMSDGRDVYVHTSSYSSFYRKSFFILIAIIFCNNIILHIHPTHFNEFLKRAKGFKKQYIYFLLKRINIFVVLTKEMKYTIHELFSDKRVYVLPNPVSIEAMVATKSYVRAENQLLYLGHFFKEKGVYDLVDAIELLYKRSIKVQLRFFGTSGREALKNYVRRKNLTNVIEINEWINDQLKIDTLYRSTMLILPSHSEGLPNVILEAMATKTPIVATHVGGLREILRNGENAIIAEVKNPRDLSDKILRCLEDHKLRRRITENAIKDAKEKFDVKVVKLMFKEILEEILI